MQLTNGRPRVKSATKGKPDLHYPVQAQVEYVVRRGARAVERGSGHAVQLSGAELILECACPLPSGMDIELRLAWPGPIGTVDGLMLRIKGRISVPRGNGHTIEIIKYDFETRRPSAAKSAKPSPVTILPQVTPLAS